MSAVPVSVAALIERLAPLAVVGDHRQRSISHISDDSRTVAPGGAFAALKGQHVDGERFLGDALTRGACVALTHSAANTTLGALGGHDACLLRVADPAAALSAAAALVAPDGGGVRDRGGILIETSPVGDCRPASAPAGLTWLTSLPMMPNDSLLSP